MEKRLMSSGDRGGKPETQNIRFREGASRPKNFLVPVILLSLREWNSYGNELMERVTAFGFEALNPGTLYRTLREMEKENLCASTWETSMGGPARRTCSITDVGQAHPDF